ncbi:hypothetical protein HD806DRAFT_240209 [Xylariaceae sp. AK1471]|nr:hypothetical protein HD806DRAFT_240209 [Xylariaceae sp. AK1471]
MRPSTLLIFAPVALAATAPRTRYAVSQGQSSLTNILATCGAGYVTCETACMRAGNVCCMDGTDESCSAGYYCIPGACCPEGEVCSGGGGGDAVCGLDEVPCGDLCMPITGTCCNDGAHYCPDFGTCTSDGFCCDLGDSCDSSGSGSGSSGTTSTFDSFPTSSTSSDDFTFTTPVFRPEPTSTEEVDSFTTPTFTAETTSDDEISGFSFPTQSSSDDSSSEFTPTPVTVTAKPSPTPTLPVPGLAGGHYTADGRVAAGLAVMAALLV